MLVLMKLDLPNRREFKFIANHAATKILLKGE